MTIISLTVKKENVWWRNESIVYVWSEEPDGVHLSLVPVYHRFVRDSRGHSGQLVQFIASYCSQTWCLSAYQTGD